MNNLTKFQKETLSSLYAVMDFALCEGESESVIKVINEMILSIESKVK